MAAAGRDGDGVRVARVAGRAGAGRAGARRAGARRVLGAAVLAGRISGVLACGIPS
ncbi:MAG TPA: hypothetical protein VGQ05_14075 [Streptosporangiaceae bacterium]|nr:hypothetical protein [Streptosporangiaceae bacterium]